MLPLFFFVAIGVVFVALGLAGAVASRHFIVVILAVEVIFAGSIIALSGYYAYSTGNSGDFFVTILSIWAVASAEAIAIIAFYICMKGRVPDFDLKKLTRLRD
ncbi:MAG: hypothetical protein KGH61_04100 [Candidatus Micrarchaeota archaeon]|nr:hypothetical protein [Candidatus Micrarchaeota archaeon]MDE1848103.1 hypothetical protein [Candidatus Micrarchaeota archaeon]MDE1864769.1 hypothetical protein [Candidatus Micrarchaeota archaeon]